VKPYFYHFYFKIEQSMILEDNDSLQESENDVMVTKTALGMLQTLAERVNDAPFSRIALVNSLFNYFDTINWESWKVIQKILMSCTCKINTGQR
jgi:hypothetical protein